MIATSCSTLATATFADAAYIPEDLAARIYANYEQVRTLVYKMILGRGFFQSQGKGKGSKGKSPKGNGKGNV